MVIQVDGKEINVSVVYSGNGKNYGSGFSKGDIVYDYLIHNHIYDCKAQCYNLKKAQYDDMLDFLLDEVRSHNDCRSDYLDKNDCRKITLAIEPNKKG